MPVVQYLPPILKTVVARTFTAFEVGLFAANILTYFEQKHLHLDLLRFLLTKFYSNLEKVSTELFNWLLPGDDFGDKERLK